MRSLQFQRIQQIEDYIMENRVVSLDEICSQLHIAKRTLRRDLKPILQNKDIKKIYGGVEFRPEKKQTLLEERHISNVQEKKEIAQLAASLVKDHDTIFVDSGTTTLSMIEGLKYRKDLIILTNNLDFVVRALPYGNTRIISLAGLLDRRTHSFTGSDASDDLQRYNINKAFMTTAGLTIEHGITNSTPTETRVKQTVVNQSQQVILLADSSKFGMVSLMTYCSFNKIDILVTDKQPPSDLLQNLETHGVKTIVAGTSLYCEPA